MPLWSGTGLDLPLVIATHPGQKIEKRRQLSEHSGSKYCVWNYHPRFALEIRQAYRGCPTGSLKQSQNIAERTNKNLEKRSEGPKEILKRPWMPISLTIKIYIQHHLR